MIHPTAILSEHVKLGNHVTIGPFSVIEENVEIGDDCRIGPHCHICRDTLIGRGTRIHTGAVVGDEPQDHNYAGEVSFTQIGKNCVLREYVTIHRGAIAKSSTIVEDNVMLMAFVHVGHNCHIENGVNVGNMGAFAGHVHVGRNAFVSSYTVVHQFTRIGRYSMVSAYARINKDVLPYCMLAEGDRIYGPNVLGLRRAGFGLTIRNAIKAAIKVLFFRHLNLDDALAEIKKDFGTYAEIKYLIDFVQTSKRGLMGANPKRGKGANL